MAGKTILCETTKLIQQALDFFNIKKGDGCLSEQIIPIYQKAALTLKEAAAYSNIGINKLREITDDRHCPFVFYVGVKRLIKRKQFDQYIESLHAL